MSRVHLAVTYNGVAAVMYVNGNPLTCTANAFGASKLTNGATYTINVGK